VTHGGRLGGRAVLITGGSRGIGEAIAVALAGCGANVTILAKTAEPHPKLLGTIYTAAKAIEEAGGKALPLLVDIRDDVAVEKAVQQVADRFGGIDICINNASAISLTDTENTPLKRFDLMMSINTRGTYATTRACLPWLKKSDHAHVLNICPPLNMNPRWFEKHVAYTMAKYGMSMCVLGHAGQFKKYGIAVNALWPRTSIATAALQIIEGYDASRSRTPKIMSDATLEVLSALPSARTGQFLIDDEVLAAAGVTDFDQSGGELDIDFFLD
jgi:NAD(P)-dependent dehydrogenase (short-subunit alcohol dehydrogenase family)